MPASLRFALISALVGALLYGANAYVFDHTPTKETYIVVTTSFFNIAAISWLFWTLLQNKSYTNAQIGSILRENLTTIVLALVLNLISIIYDLFYYFIGQSAT